MRALVPALLPGLAALGLGIGPLGEPQRSAISLVAAAELRCGLRGMLGTEPGMVEKMEADGTVVGGTPTSSALVATFGLATPLASLGPGPSAPPAGE